ncbi:MAG: sulfite exporter TauE/SafE family protein [Flavobacteriaceae bacterium]
MIDASWSELAWLALSLAASGAIGGLLAGMFGIGGGAVLVPVLYWFLTLLGVDEAVRMHISVGTSLGIIIPTSIRSFLSHKARGAVDMDVLRKWVVPVLIGVAAGTFAANFISADGLKSIFAVIALVIGFRMIFGTQGIRLGSDLPGNPLRAIIGFMIGLISTLMGVGGGVLNNTVMTLYGRPIHQAVATSSGLGVLISIPAAVGFMLAGWGEAGLPPLSLGYVNVLGLLLVGPISTACAPLGVRIAHALEKRKLEIAFGLFLLTVSARFAWSLWG